MGLMETAHRHVRRELAHISEMVDRAFDNGAHGPMESVRRILRLHIDRKLHHALEVFERRDVHVLHSASNKGGICSHLHSLAERGLIHRVLQSSSHRLLHPSTT